MSPVRAARKAWFLRSRIAGACAFWLRLGSGPAGGVRFSLGRGILPRLGRLASCLARRGHRPPDRCRARRDDRLRSKEVLLGSLGILDRSVPWRRAIGLPSPWERLSPQSVERSLWQSPFGDSAALRSVRRRAPAEQAPLYRLPPSTSRAKSGRRSVFPGPAPWWRRQKKARQGEGPVGPGFVRGEGPTQMGVAWRGAPARELLLRRSITPDLVRCNIPCHHDRRTVGRGSMTRLGVSPRSVRDSGCRPCRSRGPRPGSASAGPA